LRPKGKLVEAAGQLIPPLSRRAGLCLHPELHGSGAGRVIRFLRNRIL